MDKAALLTTIEQSYAQLDATLAQIDPAAMTAAGVEGEWSVKDMLAHISFWQERLRLRIEAALRGERLQPPITSLEADLPDGDDRIDRLNARAVAAQRQRSPGEVLDEFRSSHQRSLELIRSIPDALLADPAPIDALLDGSLIELIAGDMHEHYQEHSAALRAWLDARTTATTRST